MFVSYQSEADLEDNLIKQLETYGELYTTYSQIISTIKSRTNIFEGVLSNKWIY